MNATEPLAVLVAEDVAKVRDQIVESLQSLGVTPLQAKSGYEALKVANDKRPELILLDGLLPEMHGFEIARNIRGLDPAYHPRIVLMTAIYKSTQYQNEARLKYGVDDYLVKPVTIDDLRRLVETTQAIRA